jgi:hypothetical protein
VAGDASSRVGGSTEVLGREESSRDRASVGDTSRDRDLRETGEVLDFSLPQGKGITEIVSGNRKDTETGRLRDR